MDYVCGTSDDLTRRAKLVPWTEEDFTEDVDYQQTEPSEQYFNVRLYIHYSMIYYFFRFSFF